MKSLQKIRVQCKSISRTLVSKYTSESVEKWHLLRQGKVVIGKQTLRVLDNLYSDGLKYVKSLQGLAS